MKQVNLKWTVAVVGIATLFSYITFNCVGIHALVPFSHNTRTEKPFNRLSNLELNISAIKMGPLGGGRRETEKERERKHFGMLSSPWRNRNRNEGLRIKCNQNLSQQPTRQFPPCLLLKPLGMFLPTDAVACLVKNRLEKERNRNGREQKRKWSARHTSHGCI